MLIEFDVLDAAIRLFADGYAERYEEQPHAVMRKNLTTRLRHSAKANFLSDDGKEKHRCFIELATNSLNRYIEPMFDTWTS